MPKTILECKSLNLTVGYKTLFRNLSLSFSGPGLYIIQGENGAGKSSFLKEIYHYAKISENWHFPEGEKTISYLGHELGLYTSLSLSENISYYSSLSEISLSEEDVLAWINRFKLEKRTREPVYMFSRGMKQKAALIRTFLSSPEIVLLDEPYTGLDLKSTELFTKILNEEMEKRMILIVLHEIPKGLNHTEIINLSDYGNVSYHVS
ncbi:ABC transporter ATP-binding protein [Leptospira kobayashii]|uniref:ABC transporter ATP-binding protein n=1 Tax=Leptospira kobayashii TaxID=1917830 RepID=A0ABN6KGI4_9LEPT|nr:ATP-binding cassette domain-containing protein [Leptospira kobayashii]BDA79082.1 ABC transporter ATP-binding protein [Leptospira kobayashii]